MPDGSTRPSEVESGERDDPESAAGDTCTSSSRTCGPASYQYPNGARVTIDYRMTGLRLTVTSPPRADLSGTRGEPHQGKPDEEGQQACTPSG